jgi:integrase
MARKKALSILGDIADGDDPTAAREAASRHMTVAELCVLYLAEGCSDKKPSTLATDRGRIERHIKPLLGKRDIFDIKRRDVDQFMRDVADGKTKADIKTGKQGRAIVRGGKGTASRTVGLLGGIYSFAVERGIVDQNQVRGIKRYKDKRVERFLSEDELSRLGVALANAEASGAVSLYAIVAIRLLLLTGARKGEILSLQWEWIDFERGIIFLPDSKTGMKPIFMSAPVMQILSELPRMTDNPYVICGEHQGSHIKDLKRTWNRVRVDAGLQSLRLHDLRHHFASVGAMGGLSLPMIGKLLGHSRSETTARYSHLADDPVRRANDEIGNRIQSSMLGSALRAEPKILVKSGKTQR